MRPCLAGFALLLAACSSRPVPPQPPPAPLEEKGPPLADGTWFFWAVPANDPDRATTITVTREGVCTVVDRGTRIRAGVGPVRRITFQLSAETRDELSREIERAQLARLPGREPAPQPVPGGFSCGTREGSVSISVRMAIAPEPGATHWIRRECTHPILAPHRHDWYELYAFCRDRILPEARTRLKP